MNDDRPERPAGPARTPRQRGSRLLPSSGPRWAAVGLATSVVVALPVLAMTWSALRAPDSTQRIEQLATVEYGIDPDWSFSGQPSAVYPSGELSAVRSEDGALDAPGPIYRRLLRQLDVAFTFAVDNRGAERVESSYAVDVRVSTPDGWTEELAGVEPTAFRASAAETVSIDLGAVAFQVARIAELTGIGGTDYTVSVLPRLDVGAEAGETDATGTVDGPLAFVVEGDVITTEGAGASRTLPLNDTVTERATYAIGPFDTSTQTARAVLSGLSLVVVAGIAWFASVLFGGVGLHEPARIAARYRSRIVDVAIASSPPGQVIMVSSIEELARIAKVDENVILHEDLGHGAHRYRVFLGNVTYEYETAPEHAGGAAAPVATNADPSD